MLNTLQKYKSPPEFEIRLRQRYGRSLMNANIQQAVQNDVPAQILNCKSNDRSDQLLKARGVSRNKGHIRGWGLAFLTAVVGGINWPSQSHARTIQDHANLLSDWLTSLADIPMTGPAIVALLLGVALFQMQVVAVRQRNRILNCIEPQDEVETMPKLLTSDAPKETTTWAVDAATRQGLIRTENQDDYAVLQCTDGSVVLIVCDGAGGVKGGREAAQSAVTAIRTHLEERGPLELKDLETAIEAARERSQSQDLRGVTTAILVLLQGDKMAYATLGDGAVAVIWPDGMVAQVQVPHHNAGAPSNIINAFIGQNCHVSPRTGQLRLETGAFVMAMSDGASDLFPFEEFALNRSKYRSMEGLADTMLSQLEAARDPVTKAYLHHDNMTLALAQLTLGGENG